MQTLTKQEVMAVSGGGETVSDIPYPVDGDCALPPYINAYDPLPPIRQRPQIGPGHPFP